MELFRRRVRGDPSFGACHYILRITFCELCPLLLFWVCFAPSPHFRTRASFQSRCCACSSIFHSFWAVKIPLYIGERETSPQPLIISVATECSNSTPNHLISPKITCAPNFKRACLHTLWRGGKTFMRQNLSEIGAIKSKPLSYCAREPGIESGYLLNLRWEW